MGFVLHEDKVKREGSLELEFFCPSSGFCFPQRLSEERRRIRGEKKREKEFLSPQKRKRENLLCLSIFLNKKQALPNTQLYFYLKHTTKHICLIINTENTCCQHFLNYNFYIILNNNTKNLQSNMT